MADNFDTSGLMKMFTDAISKSMNAKYRSGAQEAIGAANAIGGVYAHQLQANEMSDTNALTSRRIGVEENLGQGKLDVENKTLGLERDKAFMPMAKGVGALKTQTSPTEFDAWRILNNYNKNIIQ